MAYEKLTQLLLELIRNTELGNLKWEGTAADGVYQVSFPRFTVQLSERDPDRPDCTFVLSILNSEGAEIEQATHEDFSGALKQPYSMMKQLYAMARRRALGVEDAIDVLLKNLSDEIPF